MSAEKSNNAINNNNIDEQKEKQETNPILHVVVVGFHHKKGCQVEYSYPPLIPGNPVDSHELPDEWRHLPSLALPDGAHNYTKDTIYFHLPSRDGDFGTIYGVSCYQQMDSKDLLSRSEDVTRNTVQKSVCVLSRLPLYGLIQAKLELITHAYFDERDFSKVELLIETYQNLSSLLTDSQVDGTEIFLGLPARDLVVHFRHKVLVLFKLLMLERRVLFTGKPVQELCRTMLGIMSLFPGLIEFGLKESACYSPHRQLSPTLKFTQVESDADAFLEVSYHKDADCQISMSHPRLFSRSISMTSEPEHQTILRDENHVQESSNPLSEKDANTDTSSLSSAPLLKESGNNVEVQGNKKPDTENDLNSTLNCTKQRNGVMSNALKNEELLNNNQSLDNKCLQTSSDNSTEKPPKTELIIEMLSENDSCLSSSLRTEDPVLEGTGLSSDDLKRSVSIEELDSPESISKIDREDCFSMEGVFLQIDDGQDSKSDSEKPDRSLCLVHDSSDLGGQSDQSASPADYSKSKPTTKRDPILRTASGNADSSSSVMVYDDFSQDWEAVSNTSNTSAENFSSAPAVSTSPNHSAGLTHTKFKQAFNQPLKKPSSLDLSDTESTTLQQDGFGLPLAIFSKGCLCHPYLSLQFYDLLEDINVRGFVIGATNILFKQRKHLTDVVVEINDGRIVFNDFELKKQLNLTTTDLRFADFLVKIVTDGKSLFLDGTEWEGGDEWVRAQFKEYILALLSSVQKDDEKCQDDFNQAFIQAWKTTHNYRLWQSKTHPDIEEISPIHPFQGQLNMNDLKVRLSHTMQSTDKGKKINAAVSQTGKYVLQTGKAVGGAITSAKSAMSSWLSSFTTDWKLNDKEPATVTATNLPE